MSNIGIEPIKWKLDWCKLILIVVWGGVFSRYWQDGYKRHISDNHRLLLWNTKRKGWQLNATLFSFIKII